MSYVARYLHEQHHRGVQKTLNEMEDLYIANNLHANVEKVVKHCVVCQAIHSPHNASRGGLEHRPVPNTVFDSESMDFVDLPTDQKGFDCAFVIVDRLSGFIIVEPCTKLGLTSENAAKIYFHKICKIFGLPREICTAKDSAFIGSWWKTTCGMAGVHHRKVMAYRPQANGRAERAVKSTIEALRVALFIYPDRDWSELVPLAVFTLNTSPAVTGLSPFELVFGRKPPPHCKQSQTPSLGVCTRTPKSLKTT